MTTVPNPNATATISLEGLAIYCYNRGFDGGRGRWEIGIPRFSGANDPSSAHAFTMRFPGLGVVTVGPEVQAITINANNPVTPSSPTYMRDPFLRTDNNISDAHDYRWIIEIDNQTEIPHGAPMSIIKRADVPDRVDVTMLFVHDAICYTRTLPNNPTVLATQRDTGPVNGTIVTPLPNNQVGALLDGILQPYGFSANTVGLDIETRAGGSVDFNFSTGLRITIANLGRPQPVHIKNLEAANTPAPPGSLVTTVQHTYGRGDFYLYYNLLGAPGDHLHMWERTAPNPGPADGITGDCNGGRISFVPDLHDLP